MRFRASFLVALLAILGASPAVAQQSVKALWGSRTADVWALTEAPAVLHFDGRAWSQSPMTGMGTPLAIWGSGPRDVFVVGERGLAVRWDGSQWSRLTTGVTRDLVAIAGRSATEVYVVGQAENNTDRPVLLRWDGRQFSTVPLTIPFLAQSLAVTPTEVVVAGYAMYDPNPAERRTYGVVARLRGTAWTLGGFDGQRATDPTLAGAAWTRVCVAGTTTTLVGQREDGTQVVLAQRAGRWSPMAAPTLPANAHASNPSWVFAQDCTPLFLFQEGFARYAAGNWQVVAPGLAAASMTPDQELITLSQQMQAQIQAGRMPTQQQIMRISQLQQAAMGQVQGLQAAAESGQRFAFGSAPAGWGATGADFWVGTESGRLVHVTADSARVTFDPFCAMQGMAGMPQCAGVQGSAAPRTAVPQPNRPPNKPRP